MKHARIKIDHKPYRQLRGHILDRDGWRCQNCGASTNLQVHHVTWRSKLGADSEENLITLCATCHSQVHNRFGSKTFE
jgi:5-methylcytosine-specific restriction endonuclease McrA